MSVIPMTTTFTIDKLRCKTTGKPFGAKYAGEFTVRRPSLLDRKNIAVKDAASLSYNGVVPVGISDGPAFISYIDSYITTVATTLPEWWNLATMHEEEDEDAVLAAWSEVVAFLDSFRREADGETGSRGSSEP